MMRRRVEHRRGNYAVWGASSLFVTLGFSALVVDVGSLYATRAQLVVAADAAALAGAAHLDRTLQGLDDARAAALAVGSANGVFAVGIGTSDLIVELGVWDGATHTFSVSADPLVVDTVQVTTAPWAVWTPFAGAAWSRHSSTVGATSRARRPPPTGAAAVDCFLPIALAQCTIDKVVAKGHPWVGGFRLGSDALDDMAWAHPDGRGASLIGGALADAAQGTCPREAVAVGDTTQLTNGSATSSLHVVEQWMRNGDDPWDGSLWGSRPAQDAKSVFTPIVYPRTSVIQGPVMIFDAGNTPCSQVKYVNEAKVTGFVWGAIFDAYTGPGSRKGVQVYLDLEHEFVVPGKGGGSAGNVVSWPQGRLVE